MRSVQYDVGDLVFAASDILNDGGLPGVDEAGLIAAAGTRGVVVQFGHAELDPSREIYLVRFETGPDDTLGHPVGVLPEELTQAVPGGH
ncbi:nitrogen fixation protein NifZ [Nitrogeniibacter mangrovi]|uniref:Nitrogen fixation protein NifZ n=1 Tax=Nitrogeniibacter mangrovi TaxID=2016596 RepID=A0A6C1B6W1_9RHOO|nr:nitrogen fixation protein NifZ [Nitrogeniibacter mangrovi]QID19492.1 nitrogen fixation protein NifZ [Nitrogeniibacter mangrovi]